jgi:hypothetical protein
VCASHRVAEGWADGKTRGEREDKGGVWVGFEFARGEREGKGGV